MKPTLDEHEASEPAKILKPVFFPAAGLIFTLVVISAVFPSQAADFFQAINGWALENVGWYYLLIVSGLLVFAFCIAFSRYGHIRLGPDHSQPDFGFLSWFAMLFSAGMGIGLLFFSVAEPITHFANPPTGEAQSREAAQTAMQITFFHWGLHAWAIYATVGLILAYFGFRRRLPLTIRSALYPLFGDRIYGPIGHVVDIFAVLGTLFGVATSLGFGVTQVNAGMNHVFGLPVSVVTQVILIAIITAAATASVVSGLDAGIRRLSELNMIMAAILVCFVLVAGPTLQTLNGFVENIGMYLQSLVERSFSLNAYSGDGGWVGGWTIFYWGWWISWSPFVGMFIARISRGRTVREFVLGALLVPSILSFAWLTIFGTNAVFLALEGQGAGLIEAVGSNMTMPLALFRFLESIPLAEITTIVATALVITFFVTSSDSGSLVIDIITAGGRTDAPTWQRVFWAVTEGVVAAVLMLAGGLEALQTAAIATAIPFSIIILIALFGLMKSLQDESLRIQTAPSTTRIPAASEHTHWQRRLSSMLAHPNRARVEAFIEQRVRPALAQVAEEIENINTSAQAELKEDRAELIIRHGGESDFRYAVKPQGYLKPTFAFPDLSDEDERRDRYFRAEVHLIEGGKGYDIFGYSKDQIIHDVLNQYHNHIQYLHLARA